MSTSVSMPALGESVSEGTVTRWLKHEGDRVEADEPLLEVSTDKVDTEIPSPAAGVLEKILVGEDETVAVGAELALIGSGDGGSASQPAEESNQPQQSDTEQTGDQQGGDQQAGDQQAGDQQGGDQQGGDQQAGDQQAAPAQASGGDDSGAQQPAAPADVAQPSAQPQQDDVAQPAQSQEAQPAQEPRNGDAGGGRHAKGTPVTMPALGESVTEGTITRWLKKEGESVVADEALLEVSTDKVDTEIPAPVSGTLQKILVSEDETVAVGAELALIGAQGDASATQQAAPAQQPAQAQQAPAESDGQQQPGDSDRQKQEAPAQEANQEAPQTQPQSQPQPAPQAQPPAAEEPRQPQQAPAQQPQGDGDGAGGAYVTPLVRKLASEHGVDLANLSGTGVGGRIRKQDVLEAAAARREQESADAAQPSSAAASGRAPTAGGVLSPLRGSTEKMSRLRRVIAQRMVESLQVSAQLTTVVEVDLTRVARLRARAKSEFEARENVKLSFLPFLAKATIEALKAHPKLNASLDIDKGEITYYDSEHLGVAVDTDRGLLVPVVKNAGDLNIAGLARKIADLAERTRSNKITPDELGGGTFTLTNTGSRGALFDTPIINQPQVGILGTGAVVKRPVVVDDEDLGETIAIRSMVYLALSYDHRLVDGADAARFLTTVKQRLEEGKFEADLGL